MTAGLSPEERRLTREALAREPRPTTNLPPSLEKLRRQLDAELEKAIRRADAEYERAMVRKAEERDVR